jgi:hypothetical protein
VQKEENEAELLLSLTLLDDTFSLAHPPAFLTEKGWATRETVSVSLFGFGNSLRSFPKQYHCFLIFGFGNSLRPFPKQYQQYHYSVSGIRFAHSRNSIRINTSASYKNNPEAWKQLKYALHHSLY